MQAVGRHPRPGTLDGGRAAAGEQRSIRTGVAGGDRGRRRGVPVRAHSCSRRRLPARDGGHGGRRARSERRRQDDPHRRHLRPGPSLTRRGARPRRGRLRRHDRTPRPHRGAAPGNGALRRGDGVAEPPLRRGALRGAPCGRADRRGARAGRAPRARPRRGARVLRRDAAAARDRAGVAPRPAALDPRRADSGRRRRGAAPDLGAHPVAAGGRSDGGAHDQLSRRGRGLVRPRRDPARRQAGRRGHARCARSAHGPVPRAGVLGAGRDGALGRAADAPRRAAGRDRGLRSAGLPRGRHDARGRRARGPPGVRRGGLPHALAGPGRGLPFPHREQHRAVSAWRLFRSSAALEAAHLLGSRGFVALTALAAVSFLAMVSLFGLTGSYAPVALIDRDGGSLARRFVEALDGAHHSFALKYMSAEAAEAALGSGRLVGIITIPAGFSDAVARGTTVAVDVRIDNVNVDLTNDVQRALPAAIVGFAIFTSVGAWLGALLKRTLAAVPLLFGLAMPFYVDSGALEPTRFDGEAIWALAHLSPVYYAVGVLEWAFHGLHVTPEPVWVDLLVLVVIAVVAVILTLGRLARGATR